MSTQKNKAWDYALGIIKVDGLEPSPEFLGYKIYSIFRTVKDGKR
ncbi:hypothetical protein SBF1_7270005 [Candidatus Desulfosporosinus infrequens]|uniref:Uncharacterized protein n=1 Tax=Candidatus Desulfosporosinus infrequens TaxID=2043169 RepID=A0A2U3LQA9_9FIRM|nr:hypothetical protein SBF1_7270005 [Candidatus Desulfosporosinus infrequens]